jgi:hypothetical protein
MGNVGAWLENARRPELPPRLSLNVYCLPVLYNSSQSQLDESLLERSIPATSYYPEIRKLNVSPPPQAPDRTRFHTHLLQLPRQILQFSL